VVYTTKAQTKHLKTMKTVSGFTLMDAGEFTGWLKNQEVHRIVSLIQNHHTYIPSYAHFNGSNHFARLKAMRDYHVGHNGWNDIAQNFTTFPDGTIATGRPLQAVPVGIKGHNARGICIEHLGNFDTGQDSMTAAHRDTAILVNAALCSKFNLTPSVNSIVYHHWFDLNTGKRTGGSGVTKTCPGSAFFGGNKEQHARKYFIPLINEKLTQLSGTATPLLQQAAPPLFYYFVTASNLNVRSGPGPEFDPNATIHTGSIVPVFKVSNGWLQVDQGNKWVSDKFGLSIGLATVKANLLNVRSGPGTNFQVVSSLKKNEEVFIYEETNGWIRTAISEQWVRKDFLNVILPLPS